MPKPEKKTDKADATRERILAAAARLFRARGYAAVTLRDIAAAAKMQAGSVYYHFDSKESIVTEILDTGIHAVHKEVQAAIAKLPKDASAAAIVRAGISAHLKTLFEYSDYTSANVRIYAQVPPAVRKANLRARREYEALWDALLARVAASGQVRESIELKTFKLLLISSLNATLEWFDAKRGNLDDLASRYADIMLHGLLRKVKE